MNKKNAKRFISRNKERISKFNSEKKGLSASTHRLLRKAISVLIKED